ncbi:hypothetical protein L0F63_002751 [Massospora cicadina]|nr:hypothetical protein L0F63_002751 [Massospora cicadina]
MPSKIPVLIRRWQPPLTNLTLYPTRLGLIARLYNPTLNHLRAEVRYSNSATQPSLDSGCNSPVLGNIYSDVCDENPRQPKSKGVIDREYVYGYCSLLPIFKLKRRKIYKLFILESFLPKEELPGKAVSPVEAFLNRKVRKKARQHQTERDSGARRGKGVKVLPASRARLDQLSEGSPHQVRLKWEAAYEIPGGCRAGRYPAFTTVKVHRFTGNLNVTSYELLLSDGRAIRGPDQKRHGVSKPPLWVVLDRIQDPHNLGAIIRSAHYLGADGVIITCEASAGPTPTVSKTSAGALEVLPVCQIRGLGSFLSGAKLNGWLILGTGFTENALPVSKLRSELDRPTLIVLGNEGSGMSPAVFELCHHILQIPGHASGAAEVGSLNVSVAAGILINALRNFETA